MFKRFWWVYLVMAGIGQFLGGVIAAGITLKLTKIYESRATVELINHTSDTSLTDVPVLSGKLKSREGLEVISIYLDLEARWGGGHEITLNQLDAAVSVKSGSSPGNVDIIARHHFREDARDVAAAMGFYCVELFAPTKPDVETLEQMIKDQKCYVERSRENFERHKKQEMGNVSTLGELMAAEKSLLEAEQSLAELVAQLAVEKETPTVVPVTARLVEAPSIPEVPIYPNVGLNLGIGRMVGLLCSPILAFLSIMLLKRRVKSSVSEPPPAVEY